MQSECHTMVLEVRDAREEDSIAGSEVMRLSIAVLCVADHKNDPAIMSKWLGNKTPEIFRSWIRQPGNNLLVATQDKQILAVGSVTDAGTITLNYVCPGARFQGVSKALLKALEQRAADRGCKMCSLNSTETARRFYLGNGYVEVGPPESHFGTNAGYPMSKQLVAPTA